MSKFYQGQWPVPKPSIPQPNEDEALDFIFSSGVLEGILVEMREGISGFNQELAELAGMEEWEVGAHVSHRIKRGYLEIVGDHGWEIVGDRKDQLEIYIPSWETLDPHDLDQLTFFAKRDLFIHRERPSQ